VQARRLLWRVQLLIAIMTAPQTGAGTFLAQPFLGRASRAAAATVADAVAAAGAAG